MANNFNLDKGDMEELLEMVPEKLTNEKLLDLNRNT